MRLVMGSRIACSCLTTRRLIADGRAADVRRNPDVIRAYLGTHAEQRHEPVGTSMLTLERIAARYGRISALEDVTLAGTPVSLGPIGANGAGKTTTLKTISALRPAAGRIIFDGDEIHAPTPREIPRRGLPTRPEGPPGLPYMTVHENLEMGAYVRADAQAVTADLGSRVRPLPHSAERRPGGRYAVGRRAADAGHRARSRRGRGSSSSTSAARWRPPWWSPSSGSSTASVATVPLCSAVEQNAHMALQLATRAWVMETGRITLEGIGPSAGERPAREAGLPGRIIPAHKEARPMADVFILGAGTPTPTPSRWGSAFAVKVGGEHMMFDCGPAATHKLVKMGIKPTSVDYMFFTHHHFDHDVDYPCFLLCRWDQSIARRISSRSMGR
jgi:branched-chain amino acid transport system ATP-binding protein